jgi:hypothetical protein
LAAVAAAFLLRFGITQYSGFKLDNKPADIGLSMVKQNWLFWPLGMLSGLEGFGILLLLLPAAIWRLYGNFWGMLTLAYALFILFVPILVIDMTRSYGFLFIGMVPAIRALRRLEGSMLTFRVLACCIGFSLLIPPFYVFSSRITYHPPATPQNLWELWQILG